MFRVCSAALSRKRNPNVAVWVAGLDKASEVCLDVCMQPHAVTEIVGGAGVR